jgi:hypothetical protein
MSENILPEKRYGSWTVIGKGDARGKKRLIQVICDCGIEKQVQRTSLLNGNSQSCGCLFAKKIAKANTRHGHTNTRVYESWRSMRNRCRNPKNPMYYLYGAKGIQICERWEKFENFLADMGDRPKNTSLDRIDNSEGYLPENCRWASPREQAINRCTTRHSKITYNGVVKSLSEWADDFNIPESVLYARLIRMGWDIDRALSQPVKRYAKCQQ